MDNASERLVQQLTDLDYERDLAFAALFRHDGKELLARFPGFHSKQAPDDASQVVHSLWLG